MRRYHNNCFNNSNVIRNDQNKGIKMRKIFIALLLGVLATNANAKNSYKTPCQKSYSAGYTVGYDRGKTHAYNKVGKATVILGTAVLVSLVVYQLGKESRWTATDNGLTYKF